VTRLIVLVLLAIVIVGGSRWHGVAQVNETLEQRVAELERRQTQLSAQVVELELIALAPAQNVEYTDEGLFTDLSGLIDPSQNFYIACIARDLSRLLTQEGFESLPVLDLTPFAQRASGFDGLVLLGCARVD